MKTEKLNDVLVQMKSDFDAFITTAEQFIAEQKNLLK